MHIGLIGSKSDAIVRHLIKRIQIRGASPILIDSELYPEETTLSLASWFTSANGYNLENVQAWFIRSIFLSLPVFELENGNYELFKDWRAYYIASRERYSLIVSWLRLMQAKGNLLINPVESFDYHFLKPLHIELLRLQGFPMPQTLVSNDAAQIKNFVSAFDRVVYKPVAGGSYCREIQDKDLNPENLEKLKNAPVIFQELLAGDNIRVTVVKDKVLSAVKIYTEALDYRGNEEAFEEIQLPSWVSEMCVKAAQASKMIYSGIDLIRTPAGYTILECNPSPVYLGIEQLFNHQVSESLIDLLIERAKNHN